MMTHRALSEDLRDQLIAALKHPNPNVRAGAAAALGRLGASSALKPLIETLKDPVHAVQQSASRALGMLGVRAVGALLGEIQEQQGSEFQQGLAEALGEVRDPEAVELLSAALNYLEPPARYGAADALGAIGDPRAVPALVQATRSVDAVSRYHAAEALLQIGAPEAVQALAALLDDADPRLRQLAVEGLGRVGGEQAAMTLLSTLNDPDENVRWATAAALDGIHLPEIEDVLLTTLNTPSAFIQQTIANVLRNYPGPHIGERLLNLMNEHGDLEVRLTAAKSLARRGDERGRAMILRTLNAPNQETRRMAAIALGLAGDESAVAPLLNSARQTTFDPATPRGRRLRRRMLGAMATTGPAIVPSLLGFLAAGDVRLQALAGEALLEMGPTAVEPLIRAVETHTNLAVRTQAAKLLGKLGDARAVEPLSNLLREMLRTPYPVIFFSRLFYDPGAALRKAAATALGEIEIQDGAALLLSVSRFDPNEQVNAAAERALARSGAPAVIARFAQVDVSGFINHGLVAGGGFLLTAFLAGTTSRLWGYPDAVLLVGIAVGAVLGLADGLEGRAHPLRGALTGAGMALLGGLVLGGLGLPNWLISLMAILLPITGALAGWGRLTLMQRLAGLFGGMVLGFTGAGIAALILGTIV